MLRQAPLASATLRVDPRVEVEVRAGSRAVIVRGLQDEAYDSLLDVLPEWANKALDVLAIKGLGRLALDDVMSVHVAWWWVAGQSTVRFVGAATSTFSASIHGKVSKAGHDATPEAVPPSPSPSPWQESMRYFRMSEVTDDLFDAFRNVYLALESILSHLEPVHVTDGRPEKERKWFKRALAKAGELVDLYEFQMDEGSDPVEDIYRELHIDVRNRVFHAKTGLEVFFPQDLRSRAQVAEAKRKYAALYLRLAEQMLGARFPMGGLTLARRTVQAMTTAVMKDRAIEVTSDFSDADSAVPVVSPRGEPSLRLAARVLPDFDPQDATAIIAEATVDEIQALVPTIGAFATVSTDGTVGLIAGLEGRFNPQGFDRCQFVLAVGVTGDVRPRAKYLT